jgi:hypothetical protein
LTGIEFELEEVGRGHKAGLERLPDTSLGERRVAVVLLALFLDRHAARVESDRRALVASFFARDPERFSLAPVLLADGHAIDAQRTLDEHAVARKPGGHALPAVQQRCAWSDQLKALALLEHVLLQLFPVLVASLEHPRHEGIEIGGRRVWRRLRTRNHGRRHEAGGENECEDSWLHDADLVQRRDPARPRVSSV